MKIKILSPNSGKDEKAAEWGKKLGAFVEPATNPVRRKPGEG
jgi:hypothetical protein